MMLEPSSSFSKPSQNQDANQNQEDNLECLQEQCGRIGRRNALTPDSHNIEPIRQTELQEKMSTLNLANSGAGNTRATQS